MWVEIDDIAVVELRLARARRPCTEIAGPPSTALQGTHGALNRRYGTASRERYRGTVSKTIAGRPSEWADPPTYP